MIVREKTAKSILCKSKIYDYVINAYTGCQHGCSYCYARFMRRFTGHQEPWGQFVDVKINAPDLLRVEIAGKKKPGHIWISGVCDAYQPLERRYRLTRECLRIVVEHRWPFTIQTRSALVLRDLDIIKNAVDAEVGFTITTANDEIRRIFEPHAPPINDRIRAIGELHRAGVRTFAMIAPLLPGAEELPALLEGKVDHILVDRMNYNNADWVYRKYQLEDKLTDEFFLRAGRRLAADFKKQRVDCEVIYEEE